MKLYEMRYKQLIKCKMRVINYLRSHLELIFPELNRIFKIAYAVLALQIFRMYCHPEFLLGLSLTTIVSQSVSRRIHKDVIENYCSQVWLAAKDSYPAVTADSIEIESYNEEIINKKK